MNSCPNCGHGVEAGHRFCPNCGAALQAERPASTPESEKALVLAPDRTVAPAKATAEGTQVAEEAKNLCMETSQECDDIDRELKNGYIAVRKAVEGEIKWGGLIFNPDDILRALGRFQKYFNRLVAEEAQPLSLSTKLLQAATKSAELKNLGAEGSQLDAEVEATMAAATERASQVTEHINATGNWLTEFYVAVCNAANARNLLPYLPAFAYEKEQPSKAGLKPRSFLDFFLGRD